MIKDGQMVFHVNSALYPRYGKFVRIGPNRLRIQGLDAFYDMHYVGSSYAKDPTFYHLFGGIGQSMFMTFDAREHRVRRSYFNPVFSKKKILTIEPMVKGKVELLMRRFEEKGKAEGLVNVYDAYGAFTMDTVSEFIYDGSLEYGTLFHFRALMLSVILTYTLAFCTQKTSHTNSSKSSTQPSKTSGSLRTTPSSHGYFLKSLYPSCQFSCQGHPPGFSFTNSATSNSRSCPRRRRRVYCKTPASLL